MDPAPGGPGRRRQHVDEGGDVVVGDRLALGDRLDREGRGADRLEVLGRRPVLERLGGGDLDVAPRGHARLVGPDGAELGTGVAGDHAPVSYGGWRPSPSPSCVAERRRAPGADRRGARRRASRTLIEADPRAFRRKFRKMAADPFAFYRGRRCLFYDDVARLEDPWADERTGRVWIQGDLHAENYGTYMDSAGIFVFDVNDFDEAYLGHYTWDLQRMAASLALLGFGYALSDETIEADDRDLRGAPTSSRCARSRPATATRSSGSRSRRRTACSTEFLQARATRPACDLLDSMTDVEVHERRFSDGSGVRRLEDDERDEVLEAYRGYLETIPETKRQQSVSYEVKDVVGRKGFGIGSAGLPAYNLLVEGRTQALDNDVVLSMKQGNVPAPSRVVDDGRPARVLRAPGPPHGGLAAGAAGALRPVARLVRARRRSARSSRSSRRTRTTSTGARSPSPTRSSRCCAISARRPPRSTASPTPPATSRSSTSRSRRR